MGGGKKKKGLKRPDATKGTRIGLPQETTEPRIDYPIFCFKHLHTGKYGIAACLEEERAALMDTLIRLGGLTWADIRLLPKHGMGSEKIAKQQLKAGIPSFISADVNSLFAFRFSGKKPFVGHLNGVIFHVLYIDRDFTLYPH